MFWKFTTFIAIVVVVYALFVGKTIYQPYQRELGNIPYNPADTLEEKLYHIGKEVFR